MTRNEAKDKIKKLLNLAKDRGATTNEAKVALNKAKALADKYEIAIRFADGSVYGASKVETKQEEKKNDDCGIAVFIPKYWNKYLARVISQIFHLNAFIDYTNHVIHIKNISKEKFNYVKVFYANAMDACYENLQHVKYHSVGWSRKDSIRFNKEFYLNIVLWLNRSINETTKQIICEEYAWVPYFVEARRNKIEKYAKEV